MIDETIHCYRIFMSLFIPHKTTSVQWWQCNTTWIHLYWYVSSQM